LISRVAVLQGLLSLFEDPHYLEVGVSSGATFWKVEARRKVAVDPAFKFDLRDARAALPNANFHPVTSDVFFGEIASRDDPYDVIFLDGLHTAEQTLRDLLNAIQFLKPSGVIVVDDVVPNSYAASLSDKLKAQRLRRALKVEDGAWMGDVYRVVFFVAAFLQQFQFRTVSDTRGQLVLWRGRRPASDLAPRTIEAVGRVAYEQIVFEREVFRFKTYAEILEEIRAMLA
jgi:methyltransferase family protein